MAFKFYGNSKEDIYEGHIKISPPVLNCTKESLQLECAGCMHLPFGVGR